MTYEASPHIPPGLAPSGWAKVVDRVVKDGERYARLLASGSPLPRDVEVRAMAVQATAGRLVGLSRDEAMLADYLFGRHYGPLLAESVTTLTQAQQAHAVAAGEDVAGWLAARGYSPVVNLPALAAAASRTETAMLHDWERLTVATREGVADAVRTGMVRGVGPREVGRQVASALALSGDSSYSRAMNIARTEMADLYDHATMQTIRGTGGVVGYRWEAQPDACPVCQILHGQVFPPGEAPDRHHRCRCTLVPVLDDEGVEPGSYYPGEQRPRDRVESQVPESWGPLPEDLRDLLVKRGNGGWRPSWTIQRPR